MRHPALRPHPRGRRALRGQAVVEFALILPMLFGLIFGLAELAMVYASAALYNTAAYQAARVEAMAGATSGQTEAQTVKGVLALVQPYFVAHVTKIEIYQADATGAMPTNTPEDVYDGSGNALATQTFPVANRRGSPAAPLYLGVRITYQYTWFTSFVGATGAVLILQANAVTPINQ